MSTTNDTFPSQENESALAPSSGEKRRRSVKEISMMFSGPSTIESKNHFERRMRVYEKVCSLTRYASDKKALLKLTSPMKRQMLEEFTSKSGSSTKEISVDVAKQYLEDHGVCQENVDTALWEEWAEAIEIVTSPIKIVDPCFRNVGMEPFRMELSDGGSNELNANTAPKVDKFNCCLVARCVVS